jgi:hypothetical protein
VKLKSYEVFYSPEVFSFKDYLGMVACAYNLSYLGSGDQETHSSRPAQAKS